MIRRMRSIMPLFLLLLVAMPVAQVQAQQQNKTVAVMSVSSVDSLLGNVGYLGEAAGFAEALPIVTMMAGPYLEGVDRGNPIGMVLNTDGQEFSPLGFVPVKDLDKVFAAMEDTVGSPRDAGNGIKEIPGFQPIFIKEQGGFAFIGQTIESMGELPQKPVASLGNLPNEYDFAVRGFLQNIPEEYLQMAVDGLQEGVKQGLEQLPEEDRDNQARMLEAQMKQMESYIKESDELTIGWKTEPAKKRTFIDISFSAIPGGTLAKQMNTMANTTSDYSGFVVPGAAMSMNFSSEIPEEQIASSMEAIEGMKAAALKEIDRDDNLEEDGRMAAKKMAGAAIDIMIETMKTGKMDGAMSIVLDSNDLQMVGGFHVADGKDIENILRDLAEMAKNEKDFPGINFNAEKAAGVAYHTMEMPVPDDEEEAKKILGDSLEMAVGVGETSAYIGFGKNCVENLKQIVAGQPKAKKVLPFDMTMSLTPIMEFVAGIEDNPMIGAVTDALKEDDMDHVRLQVVPKQNGFTYRIELEEGILRAIGAGVNTAGAGDF